jgi:hypothetical protein
MMPRKAAGRSKFEVSRAAERAKNSGRQAKAKSIAPKTATPLRKRSALKDGAGLDHAFPVSGDRRVGLIQLLDSSYHSMLAKIFRKQPGFRLLTLRNGST